MVRIFLTYHLLDAELAGALKKHLASAFAAHKSVFWETPVETEGPQGADRFLATANLAVIVWSVDFAISGEQLLEKERIKRFERERRPGLPVLVVLGRDADLPPDLQNFALAPARGEPVVHPGFDRDQQLLRCARMATQLVETAPGLLPDPNANYDPPFQINDVHERLLPQANRQNLSPLFYFLKNLVSDAKVRKRIFEIEDFYTESYQRARLEKDFFSLREAMATVKADLIRLITQLQENELHRNMRSLFRHIERGGKPLITLFYPIDEINMPTTRHTGEGELLSAQQQQDFIRLLLLSRDALAVNQYGRAHTYADQVRTQLDPRSAQLYELLLLSFLEQETPARIIRDAVESNSRLFNHIVLYAGRLKEYQAESHSVSTTAEHNLQAAAEDLSDELWHIYDALQSDSVLETGKYAEETSDYRSLLTQCLFIAQTIYRAVHPYQGFLKTLVVELCGGGKCNWIERVELSAAPGGSGVADMRFASAGNFDVESTIIEIIGMLREADPEGGERLVYQLREDLYFSLLSKRRALSDRLAWEIKRLRPYSDERQGVINFVHACLLGFRIFGDKGNDPYEQSFLRLALEYLLPNLVQTDLRGSTLTAYEHPRNLRWFDLDENGNIRTASESERYRFDAYGIVQKIATSMSGHAGWLQVHPNINISIYQQYAMDTQSEYTELGRLLNYTDFRRPDEVDVRRRIIRCLHRWLISYRAFPEHGQTFIEQSIRELSGDGLLVWLYFDPFELQTHPDSLALGYDAKKELRALSKLSTRLTETDIRRSLAENLFNNFLSPAYDSIPARDESRRSDLCSLIHQTLQGYREYPQQVYLDFVYNELVEEIKLRWIDIGTDGRWFPFSFKTDYPLQPIALVEQLCRLSPDRYKLYDIRRILANRRYADLLAYYRREISELRDENGRVERALVIDIIRKLKGLYRFYPEAAFLDLPLRELSGEGNIRWNERFLGLLPTTVNHYESNYYDFDYKVELAEIRDLLLTRQAWVEHVMRETGYN